ncbi:DUF418 domain-containing protein [Acrocarpospora catenulata]|uniref:DUF418 domain-containing protein n=1 Tax=Acrocarpospora catenulata TaxID=2836182 RepID=UPI001BD98BD8|nr:DUF418 domain-containing protein [Acrocarpospora catenulata]
MSTEDHTAALKPRDTTASPGRPRIAALDVIRGFALCGILVANILPIANLDHSVVRTDVQSGGWEALLIGGRFFPIFSLLFGVGFSLLLRSAAERAPRPRLILLRRLLTLLAIGLVHMFLIWPGDILTIYAVIGLVILFPSTWLPRQAVAALAAVLLAASLIFSAGGGFTLVPGLLLLGSALTRYGVIDRIETSARVPAILALIFTALSVPVLWWQTSDAPGAHNALALGGLLVAAAYVCALLTLLHTPLRRFLRAVFAPLGRMALTNYLSASLVVLAIAHTLGPVAAWPPVKINLTIAAILATQWALSTLWLRHHRQGPLEWLWRWATWGHRPTPVAVAR